jgi:hypothetical protein
MCFGAVCFNHEVNSTSDLVVIYDHLVVLSMELGVWYISAQFVCRV